MPAYADFVAGIGLEGTTKGDSKNNELSHNTLVGIRGDFEFGFKHLTLNVFGGYSGGTAKSQYDFTNKNYPSDTAAVEDLKTTAGLLRFGVGARLMLIHSKRLRLFAGGGGLYGGLALIYDQDDFLLKNGSSTGFKDKEAQAVKGSYLEAGLDYILSNKFGVRLLYQKSFMRSDEFETLNNKELHLETNYISLNYIQYVDTNW